LKTIQCSTSRIHDSESSDIRPWKCDGISAEVAIISKSESESDSDDVETDERAESGDEGVRGDDTRLCCGEVIGDAWCKGEAGVMIFPTGDNGEEI